MPGAPSVQVLPRSVNPRKFAHQDARLEGTIAAENLDRLRAAVVDVQNTVAVSLHFYIDDGGKAVVKGNISTDVVMICQRCLEQVTQTVNADPCLALVLNDDQSNALPTVYDPWLLDSEDGSANLYQMVEDELLLALPMVALHSKLCIDSALMQSQESKIEDKEKRPNPFDVLEQLKTKTSKLD
jgi:uncharacterized protein